MRGGGGQGESLVALGTELAACIPTPNRLGYSKTTLRRAVQCTRVLLGGIALRRALLAPPCRAQGFGGSNAPGTANVWQAAAPMGKQSEQTVHGAGNGCGAWRIWF